jgi:hypothetical protein
LQAQDRIARRQGHRKHRAAQEQVERGGAWFIAFRGSRQHHIAIAIAINVTQRISLHPADGRPFHAGNPEAAQVERGIRVVRERQRARAPAKEQIRRPT